MDGLTDWRRLLSLEVKDGVGIVAHVESCTGGGSSVGVPRLQSRVFTGPTRISDAN